MQNQLILLACAIASAAAFQAPLASRASLALRSSQASALQSGGVMRKGRTAAGSLKMVDEEQERLFREREAAEIAAKRAQEEENERRYIQQASGLNYRKNNQDGLLAAMGASIIIIPLIFVVIAVATGYIPLDYLR
mmetsp:Transcript_45965/g.115261  ORF Transcript_45965/g.115261 Transcript_45965/m.115261 type:complete len:136 (+) Transcript_45965:53-460(+)